MSDKLNTFNKDRLSFARKRRGYSIKSLSDLLGIATKTYSNYENGHSKPQQPMLIELSRVLHFPVDFFFLEDITPLDITAVSFRSLARMSATVRDIALHAGQIALEFSSYLDRQFELPGADLPDLRGYEPEAAAEALRNEWSVGERPIKNLIHMLEAKGIRVFSLDEDTQDMDAYSFWMNNRPFIFLNTRKSVERGRFDAAHELGHLLLHKHGAPSGKEVEAEANQFASAFLMPQGSVISRATNFTTLDWIISAKSFWLVSAAALVRRLKDLGLISEWQYRSLTIDLSRRGYMRKEPNAIKQRETSKLLPMIFHALRQDGITKHDVAKELGYYSDDIDALIFNLTIFTLDGGDNGSSANLLDRSHLRVVK